MRGSNWVWGGLLAVCLAAPVRAEIYVYRDARGTLHFSNAPAAPGYKPYMEEIPRGGFPSRRVAVTPLSQRSTFYPMIRDSATRHRVDVALVKAVIQAESNFVPYAQSPKGAMGMMQLMPATARRYNAWRLWDPQENIETGVRHLRMLLDRYSGNVRLALAAYNAGEEAVERHGGIPPYRETIQYVDRVVAFRQKYLQEQ